MPEMDPNSDQFADLAAEILASGRSLCFRARGVSMRPMIKDGDLLEVRTAKTQEFRIGDILLYKFAGRQLLVHRLLRIADHHGQRRLLIQGDAAPLPDGWIPPEHILGRVISIERNGKLKLLDTTLRRFQAVLLARCLPVAKGLYQKA